MVSHLCFLFLFLFPLVSTIFALEVDDALWTEIEIGKSIKNYSIDISHELRYIENYNELQKSNSEISFSYKALNSTKITCYYRYSEYSDKFKSRLGVANKYNIDFSKIELDWIVKFQKDFENNKIPEELIFRNKFLLEFEYLSFLSPYLSYETFHQLISKDIRFEKYRISSGIKYKITKDTTIKLFYIYSGKFEDNEFEITNITGLKYEITL